jgi:uncharacterized protein YukE
MDPVLVNMIIESAADIETIGRLTKGARTELAAGWQGGDADEYLQRLDILNSGLTALFEKIKVLSQSAMALQNAADGPALV